MSLSFEDFEKEYPTTKENSSKSEVATTKKAVAPKSSSPTVSEVASSAWNAASPKIQAGIERAVNPFHYTGDQQDYRNIDWTSTLGHAGAEAVVGKRLWDFATGKSAERETARLNAETNQYNAETARLNAQAKGAPARTIPPVPTVQQAAPTQPAPAQAAPQQVATQQAPAQAAQQPTPAETFEQNRLARQRAAQSSIEGRIVTPPANKTPVEAFTPEKVPTAEQAAQQQVEQGKIKTGKAGGKISVQDANILEGNISGKAKSEVSDVVKGAVAPNKTTTEPVAVEGRIPSYPNPKRNKQGKDVIGQGGWHWYQGQMGPEAEQQWLRQFGRTNQTYADVKQAIKEGRLQGAEVKEGKGGSFPREATVPEYIRGSAPVAAMANLAGNALGALGLEKAYQHGKKTGDWSELGLGVANQLTANLAPRAAIPLALMGPNTVSSGTLSSPEAKELFTKAHAKKVGAGRGIAPPADYMR